MKRNRHFILILAVITALLLAACGSAKSTETAPVPTAPAIEAPEASILRFNNDEGSAKLMAFFNEGKIPESVTFLYDQMGANPVITETDPSTVAELYRLLSGVTVTGESEYSLTDCYHFIEFKLADDCFIHYSFEGSELWSLNGKNYSLENSKPLFSYMAALTGADGAEPPFPETEDTPAEEAPLFTEVSFGGISVEYPSGWKAEEAAGVLMMSPSGAEEYPFISVEKIEPGESADSFIAGLMKAFSEKYLNRLPRQPEAGTLKAAGGELPGYTAEYSTVDGGGMITRHEYIRTVNGSDYLIVCEYLSSASGELHEDETTYFEFINALETLK